jgi:hypothetical protein
VQNEPNFSIAGLRIGDKPAASGPRRPIVRNKANWRGRRAKQSQSAAARGTNKANFRTDRKGPERQDCRCRRAGQLCETKPIWRWPAGIRGQSRKTNPICPGRAGPPLGPIVQNEPNFGELVGTWNTQHSSIPLFQHSSVPVPSLSCEANPISRLRIVDWGRTSGGAADCAKRTQFPAGRDTPAFHHSGIPSFPSAWTRGMDCANNGRFVGWVFLIL